MAFCTNCGKSVNSGDKFCGSCGNSISSSVSAPPAAAPSQAVSPPPPPTASIPPPQPAAPIPPLNSAETVIGAFPVSRKKGMFAQESFHIVFTGQRLVFAAFTDEMVKQAAKEEGKSGFLAGMIGAATLGYNYYKHYLIIEPEAALRENPQNFSIDISRVSKIKLELGKKQVDRSRHVDVYENSKLAIETVGDNYTFAVANHFHNMAGDIIRKSGLM
jgi:hypothetical protein